MNGSEDPLVTLAEQRREDVLAHLLAPEVISAVATRQIAAVEIYPVGVRPTVDAVSTGAGTGGAKWRLRSSRSRSISIVSMSNASWDVLLSPRGGVPQI